VSAGDGAETLHLEPVRERPSRFISSRASTANLGGVDGADALCNTLANNANLGGSWRSWTSAGSSSPATRFTRPNVSYRLLDGTLIANGWNDLVDGELRSPINVDERGVVVSASTEVWTGTGPDGQPLHTGCSGFTSADGSATDYAGQGHSDKTDGGWTYVNVQQCSRTDARIYCFEQ